MKMLPQTLADKLAEIQPHTITDKKTHDAAVKKAIVQTFLMIDTDVPFEKFLGRLSYFHRRKKLLSKKSIFLCKRIFSRQEPLFLVKKATCCCRFPIQNNNFSCAEVTGYTLKYFETTWIRWKKSLCSVQLECHLEVFAGSNIPLEIENFRIL